MRHPLVSVITPSFQSAEFIEATILSVRQQDYPYIEHIIVDGGSDDGTLDILKKYPHLVWISEPDKGQSQALNKGVQMAKGEILGWLNADDIYTPFAVSKAVQFLMENIHIDAVYSDQEFINESGAIIRHRGSRTFDLPTLFLENFISQPTVFFRKKILETLDGIDENLHYSMDREFWLRMGSQYRLHYISNFVSAHFRLHKKTKTAQHKQNFHAEWERVTELALCDTRYRAVPLYIKRLAVQKARVRFHVAAMDYALKLRDTKLFFTHLFMLMIKNWNYILLYLWKKLSAGKLYI